MAEQIRKTTGRSQQKTVVVPEMGRLQPQAPELEEAVLGALMLEKDAYSIVSEILKPECFYEKAHELIYAAIVDLAVQQLPIDMMTVTEQLRKRRNLPDGIPEFRRFLRPVVPQRQDAGKRVRACYRSGRNDRPRLRTDTQ